MANDNNGFAHTTWSCKYHIASAPKYRRMGIYGDLKQDIGWILRKLCDEKGVEIVEAQIREQAFWVRGYYVDTVGRNKKQIEDYIRNQLEQDQIADQMSLKEFIDPFTGSKNSKALWARPKK